MIYYVLLFEDDQANADEIIKAIGAECPQGMLIEFVHVRAFKTPLAVAANRYEPIEIANNGDAVVIGPSGHKDSVPVGTRYYPARFHAAVLDIYGEGSVEFGERLLRWLAAAYFQNTVVLTSIRDITTLRPPELPALFCIDKNAENYHRQIAKVLVPMLACSGGMRRAHVGIHGRDQTMPERDREISATMRAFEAAQAMGSSWRAARYMLFGDSKVKAVIEWFLGQQTPSLSAPRHRRTSSAITKEATSDPVPSLPDAASWDEVISYVATYQPNALPHFIWVDKGEDGRLVQQDVDAAVALRNSLHKAEEALQKPATLRYPTIVFLADRAERVTADDERRLLKTTAVVIPRNEFVNDPHAWAEKAISRFFTYLRAYESFQELHQIVEDNRVTGPSYADVKLANKLFREYADGVRDTYQQRVFRALLEVLIIARNKEHLAPSRLNKVSVLSYFAANPLTQDAVSTSFDKTLKSILIGPLEREADWLDPRAVRSIAPSLIASRRASRGGHAAT